MSTRSNPPCWSRARHSGLGALLAADEHEHQEVEQLRVAGPVALGQHLLHHQQATAFGDRAAAVAEDRHRLLVVPVVEDLR
jgi:hypothetical protein